MICLFIVATSNTSMLKSQINNNTLIRRERESDMQWEEKTLEFEIKRELELK